MISWIIRHFCLTTVKVDLLKTFQDIYNHLQEILTYSGILGYIQPSTGDTYLLRYIRIFTTIYRRYLLTQVYQDIYNHLQEILTYSGISGHIKPSTGDT